MSPIKVTSDTSKSFLEANSDGVAVIIFDAEFTNHADEVNNCIKALEEVKSRQYFALAVCDAEENHQFATTLSVVSLPCIVLLNRGKVAKKLIDLDPTNLKRSIETELAVIKQLDPNIIDPKESKNKYLESLTKSAPVMVFMKGEPQQPRCGFSKQLVELLSRNNVKFNSFNILDDEEVRQGLKEYSNWPTYPQIYAKGEFIGGLDILKQLEESGELAETLKFE